MQVCFVVDKCKRYLHQHGHQSTLATREPTPRPTRVADCSPGRVFGRLGLAELSWTGLDRNDWVPARGLRVHGARVEGLGNAEAKRVGLKRAWNHGSEYLIFGAR